jgi:hypothetical protein
MNYFAILLKYGPLLWALVSNIEKAMPDTPGKAKLEALLAFVTATETELVGAEPQVAKAVGGIVKAYNAAGIFSKSAQAAAPATA